MRGVLTKQDPDAAAAATHQQRSAELRAALSTARTREEELCRERSRVVAEAHDLAVAALLDDVNATVTPSPRLANIDAELAALGTRAAQIEQAIVRLDEQERDRLEAFAAAQQARRNQRALDVAREMAPLVEQLDVLNTELMQLWAEGARTVQALPFVREWRAQLGREGVRGV